MKSGRLAMHVQVAQRRTKPRLHLTERDHGRRLSLEEFESAEYKEGYRYEIIHGRLYVSPLANLPHERLLRWLRRLLENYVEQHPSVINEVFGPGRVFVPDLEEGVTAPEPDLVAFRDFPIDLPERDVDWRDVSPVIAVEIISDDTAEKDLDRNVELYLRVPTIREYWVVDPRQSRSRPSLLVYRRRGQRWQKPIHIAPGSVYTTKLLPDFRLVLSRRA
jgi:Uma2 family endonuclease